MNSALLALRGARRSFGSTLALEGVDLDLHAGELLGLVGPDGAGKTTLVRALVGLIGLDAGVALVGATPWPQASGEARETLGYMPQQYSLYTDLSVDENLRFFGDLFDLPRRVFAQRRERLLRITRLEAAKDRPAGKLSGGMYKKLAIACALLHQPKCLVLDEPTNGVDPVSRRELWALLYDFVREGMGVLISTPYMDEAARCGRVVLLYQGRVLRMGEPEKLVAGFDHATVELQAADLAAAYEQLERQRGVIAVTPAGERIRAIVERNTLAEVERALAAVGAHMQPSRPDFEDLYLAEVAAHGHGKAQEVTP